MNAIERAASIYDEYLEKSGGKLPDKFRESDEILQEIIQEDVDAEWTLFPNSAAKVLNVYRRWKALADKRPDLSNDDIVEYRYFCDMVFRQVMKSRVQGTTERYEILEACGVTPETIIEATLDDPRVADIFDDLISAYAIPDFGKDAAFVDLIVNEESSYRVGDYFHNLVEKERERDRKRRLKKAQERLAAAFA